MTGPLSGPGEFDEYLAEAMEDPVFRLEYERAGWIGERWWRRLASRWAPGLLPPLAPGGER